MWRIVLICCLSNAVALIAGVAEAQTPAAQSIAQPDLPNGVSNQLPIQWPGGRMAITSDGNAQDPDDIGGTPMAIALMHAAGLSNRLVHVDYANHFVHAGHEGAAGKPAMLDEMKSSVEGAVARFGKLDPKTVFNCQTELEAATANFVKQAEQCSADAPLWFVCAGPMTTAHRYLSAVKAVAPEKLRSIRCISHSANNGKHDPDNTWDQLKEKFPEATYHLIKNQNAAGGERGLCSGVEHWDWLKKSANQDLRWLFSRNRTARSNAGKFDVSDAGMVYWVLSGTKNDKAGVAEIRGLLDRLVVAGKSRLIVLADMGNEPDEMQQILHLLICSNELDLEGLIAVTGKHLRPDDRNPYRRVLHPELLHQLIDGYDKVYPNLQLHAQGWPSPTHLRSIVANGQSGYGIADTGKGKSSPGSRLIIDAVSKPDSRPIHIVVNAGSNTLAQALIDYRDTHSADELRAFVAKLVVFENQAQDDAGAWICHAFPDIHWIRSRYQTRCYGGPNNNNLGPHQWKPFAYSVAGQDQWAAENVRKDHGALGELYPARSISNQLHFIEGGGTIPWLRLVSPGLTDPLEPSWGGWSGRYTGEKVLNVPSNYVDIREEEAVSKPFAAYTDSEAVQDRWIDPQDGKVYEDHYAPIWPWRMAIWNDFKARMDWCVQPYTRANHRPTAVINGDTSDSILRITASPEEKLAFDASGSSDPDRNSLRYRWWIYPEAGRKPYGKRVDLESADQPRLDFTVPTDAKERELHLILEVSDDNPEVSLIDYRRIVIDVE